jgi:transcriptional regulator with XRE-family HTH domain
MNKLLDIAEKLQDTQATISKAENSLLEKQPTPSVLLALESLKKRHENLEIQFEKASLDRHLDVCDYRLFCDTTEAEQPTLRGFTKTLFDFQNLFSQVYAAIKTQSPRLTTRLSAEIAQETDFGVNYTYTGSLGVVLTLPNERLLFGASDIDESIKTVFELVKLENTDRIAEYAKRLGAATIRALYDWTADQVNSGLGSQIQWKRGDDIRFETFVQFPELAKLKDAIESTSDEEITQLSLFGTLVGIDIPTRSFHLSFEAGDDIRGNFSDEMAQLHFELPKVCKAKIIKTKTVRYSTDKETIQYLLTELK